MTRPTDESMVHGSKALLRQLPSVDVLLRHPAAAPLLERHGRTLVTGQARELLAEHRRMLLRPSDHGAGSATAGSPGDPRSPTAWPIDDSLAGTIDDALHNADLRTDSLLRDLATRCDRRMAPRLHRVINLTGTVIHTNLGRALLSDAVMAQAAELMGAPNDLEFDLDTGSRGDRDSLVEPLLCELTGAQAATVVNNNAAAVLLTVAALARGREVIVSRGELVEIGGAFRMPDVMASAGATLVEVGTTNRTHPGDYQRAITPATALIMKVHPSNYAVTGFTSQVDEAPLARIAHEAGIPLAIDLGSGALVDLADYGLPHEPLPQHSLQAGCDVVTFSGDKLLGGPQAGLIVGTRDCVERIRRFPMKRALRLSKLPLAVLAATLQLYLSPETLAQRLPTLRLLTRSQKSIRSVADDLLPLVSAALAPDYLVTTIELNSQIGSGSLPLERLPSAGLQIEARPPATHRGRDSADATDRTADRGSERGPGRRSGGALERLARALRALPEPVIGRISDHRLLLDLRCLEDPRRLAEQLPGLRELLSRHVPSVDGQPADRESGPDR